LADITDLLNAIAAGDTNAATQLWGLVYNELRKLAAAQMADERPDHTLSPTALVHEAWLRLAGQTKDGHFANRRHFFAAAAEAMRRILVDSARLKGRQKHGGDRERVELDGIVASSVDSPDRMLDLNEAIDQLAAADAQAAELVKLRYFAGFSVAESAKMLEISPRSADFLWAYARAFLLRSLAEREQSPG
jgi:RNA polymerase sigma factor (TIGR02999 family)